MASTLEHAGTLSLASRPYPWPYDGMFAPARTALLVCVGDTPAVPDAKIFDRLSLLLGDLRGAGCAAILLPAAESVPEAFAPSMFDAIVDRPSPGGFTASSLGMVLRNIGRTDLLFSGFPFEIGADCTMRQANDLGFECLALDDCSTGEEDDTFAGAMSSVTMSGGIFGAVAGSEDVRDLIRRWQAAQTSA